MMRVVWRLALLFFWGGAAHGAAMGEDTARHLLLRTGFAPTEAEVRQFAGLTREAAVDRLLGGTTQRASNEPPQWVGALPPPRQELRHLSEAQRQELRQDLRRKGFELRAWWYGEMLTTPSPLTERMTLFWHNHFVSSLQKVKVPQFMYRQNVLLRQHALGNFGTLLHAVARDPAMVLYLDNVANRKGQPNENFAREVMELFTLGVGHYGEQDVREAARAFTGWGLDRNTREFRFYPFLHDDGDKHVLGRSGKLDGDAVLDVLLAQPATAEFVVAKLWREFIGPRPDDAESKRLAQVFRDARYEIKPLLRALFLSDAFYAAANRASLVKSPVELLVGTARQFEIQGLDPRLFALAGRQMGQDVLAPPNVRGWPGGDDWINSTTLLARKQVLERLFRAEEMSPAKLRQAVAALREGSAAATLDPAKAEQLAVPRMNLLAARAAFDVDQWFAGLQGTESARRAQAEKLVLAMPPTQADRSREQESRLEFVRHLVLDPGYQLK